MGRSIQLLEVTGHCVRASALEADQSSAGKSRDLPLSRGFLPAKGNAVQRLLEKCPSMSGNPTYWQLTGVSQDLGHRGEEEKNGE
jgi:hypothetical protein